MIQLIDCVSVRKRTWNAAAITGLLLSADQHFSMCARDEWHSFVRSVELRDHNVDIWHC